MSPVRCAAVAARARGACLLLLLASLLRLPNAGAQPTPAPPAAVQAQNAATARRFYEEVWFRPNLGFVDSVFAPTYVVHDVGDRKGAREPAAEQKEIAGWFWRHGAMGGHIEWQMADGDKVATRWIWTFHPTVWWTRIAIGDLQIAIVNIMRFENGRVVEIWNHRLDIDGAGRRFQLTFAAGVLAGALAALLAWGVTALVRRRARRAASAIPGAVRPAPA